MDKKKKKEQIKKENAQVLDLIARYLTIFLVSHGDLWIFYFIFSPLTLYSSAFFLRFSYDTLIIDNFIFLKDVIVEISKACVAGSAYYLLFMLNFLTKGIKLRKRMLILLFTSSLFLALNVARIIFLAFIRVKQIPSFDTIHMIFWYFVSIIYVFIVWVIAARVFDIKEIPFYSDYKYIRKLAKGS